MDFFERQELARTEARKIVLLFLVALPCVISAVYVLTVGVYAIAWAFFAFWRSVFVEIHSAAAGSDYFIPVWQLKLFLWVAVGTLLVVVSGSLHKIRQLVPGGQVVGATDADGGFITSPMAYTIEDYAATIYEKLGIDRNQPLQAPSGRPYYLVKDGRPIPELF